MFASGGEKGSCASQESAVGPQGAREGEKKGGAGCLRQGEKKGVPGAGIVNEAPGDEGGRRKKEAFGCLRQPRIGSRASEDVGGERKKKEVQSARAWGRKKVSCASRESAVMPQ